MNTGMALGIATQMRTVTSLAVVVMTGGVAMRAPTDVAAVDINVNACSCDEPWRAAAIAP